MPDEPITPTPALAAEPVASADSPIQLPEDHPLVKTLAAQKTDLKTAREELRLATEKVKSFEGASQTEIEKANNRIKELEGELTPTQLKAARYSVALDKGLTKAQARRLVGTTKDELLADADVLLADLKNAPKPGTAPSSEGQGKQGEPVGQTKQITSRDQLKNMSREEQLAAYRNGELKALTG
jgi:hypothetical protein